MGGRAEPRSDLLETRIQGGHGARFPDRIRSGERAQQWFKLYSSHVAELYQQVFNVAPGVRYRFSVWAQVWSSVEDNPATVSTLPADPNLQIGVDPFGFWNPFSPDVVWSGLAPIDQIIDRYGHLSVEVTAQSDNLTVFVKAVSVFANKHSNSYIDDASLVALGPSPSPPTATPLPATNIQLVCPRP